MFKNNFIIKQDVPSFSNLTDKMSDIYSTLKVKKKNGCSDPNPGKENSYDLSNEHHVLEKSLQFECHVKS